MTAPLPGFEQDDYAALSGANTRTLQSILTEYAAVREATIALFEGLDEAALVRSGSRTETAPPSAPSAGTSPGTRCTT